MQTFDQALLGHLQAGRINMEEALKASTHPHDFKLLVAAEGRRSTSMTDVAEQHGGDGEDPGSVSPNGNGNGTPHPEPAGAPPSPPAPVTPLTPVTPEDEPDTLPSPPPPPAAAEEAPAATGSVPPPGVA
jgi:hypothetical protein